MGLIADTSGLLCASLISEVLTQLVVYGDLAILMTGSRDQKPFKLMGPTVPRDPGSGHRQGLRSPCQHNVPTIIAQAYEVKSVAETWHKMCAE
jgi:hypothetical protein